MHSSRRSRFNDGGLRRSIRPLISALLAVAGVVFLLRDYAFPSSGNSGVLEELEASSSSSSNAHGRLDRSFSPPWLPNQTSLSSSLEKRNLLPPRNSDLFPNLPEDHTAIVLYVHNRPQYLRVVVDSLSNVEGIGKTLLIVSHDGYFKEMDEIVQGISFCQVKQIFAPYSPHLFPESFPGVSPGDCRGRHDATKPKCNGNPDQYANHRSPRIVSLKHHWWWMMNMVWDGLAETRGRSSHVVFIEEDHFIFPNAYRNLQMLASLKAKKCPDCFAMNLAPLDVKSKGEGWPSLVAEKMGNVGYAFNRTIWKKIHAKARDFCSFDDYNWDITMWAAIFPSFGSPVYSLRGSRASAVHFGKCGLHQGQDDTRPCVDKGSAGFDVEDIDKHPNIQPDWHVRMIEKQGGYQPGFKGWGGWGDERDRSLCLSFSQMYHFQEKSLS